MSLLKLKDYPHRVRLLTGIREESGCLWLIANHFDAEWHEELEHSVNNDVYYEHRVYGFKDPKLAAEFALRFS